LVVREGMYNSYNVSLHVYLLSVLIKMSEQVVPSAVVQRIVKFLTNENVKHAEIMMRLRAQFCDETLLSNHM
jgi:hypothetical protein